MAMAHPNPGVGKRQIPQEHQPFRRVTSAPPDIIRLRQVLRPLHPEKIYSIRESAKDNWKAEYKRNHRSVTTYNALHTPKQLDEPTQNRARPTSRDRHNRPHPPNIFLVTRLKKIEGCYSPDEAAVKKYGKSAQESLDKYVSEHKLDIRRAMRGSPIQRPYTSKVDTDDERAKMQTLMGQVPAQATEAWMKLSNDKDKHAIRKAFKETEEKLKRELETTKQPTQEEILQRRQHPTLRPRAPANAKHVYSTTRWLKRAGAAENESIRKLLECLENAPPKVIPKEGPHFHITDYAPMFASAPKETFYDFQIHPEWHMPWHKKYETVRY